MDDFVENSVLGMGRFRLRGHIFMEYYESRLNESEQQFYRDVYDCLVKRKEIVKTPCKMTEEQLLRCIEAVQFDYPELFYVDFHNIAYWDNDEFLEYCPEYLYSLRESNEKWDAINSKSKKIISIINKNGAKSTYQKCGWIHNYLVKNCPYNYEAIGHVDEKWPAYTIEGVFLEGTAVCQGVALAYRLLCKLVGVEAIVVSGLSLQPGATTYERHAWNIVSVGDACAHVDATWDTCVSKGKENIRYDYFFLPDLEMMRDHQYVGYPICRQLKASYFERAKIQFSELQDLEEYIKNECMRIQREPKESKLYIYFKMKNRKETQDEINDFIIKKVQEYTRKAFSYTAGSNKAQSVFDYHVEFKI